MSKLLITIACLILISGCSSNQFTGKEEKTVKNKSFQIANLELKVDSIKVQDEVKPKDPQGYYKHYKKMEGYHYQVLSGSLVNLSDDTIELDRIKVQGISKSNVYQGKFFAVYSNNRNFSNKVYPKEEKKFHIISIVEDNKNDPNKYNICYNKDMKLEKDQKEFDICVTYELNK